MLLVHFPKDIKELVGKSKSILTRLQKDVEKHKNAASNTKYCTEFCQDVLSLIANAQEVITFNNEDSIIDFIMKWRGFVPHCFLLKHLTPEVLGVTHCVDFSNFPKLRRVVKANCVFFKLTVENGVYVLDYARVNEVIDLETLRCRAVDDCLLLPYCHKVFAEMLWGIFTAIMQNTGGGITRLAL